MMAEYLHNPKKNSSFAVDYKDIFCMNLNIYHMKRLLFLLVPLFLIACNREPKVDTFNEEKPLTLEITKERSYYQADRIVKRLAKMGLGAYILEENTDAGQWYRVMSGAMADSAQAEAYTHRIDSLFHLKPKAIVNYTKLDSACRVPVKKSVVKERHRIAANPPAVPMAISQIARRYPENVMFNLQKIGLLVLNDKAISTADNSKLDMPRGVKLSYLKNKECLAISAVIYEDNLYGDRVTLHVIRCKDANQPQVASLFPTPSEHNDYALALCSDLCDMILNTGNYADEEKDGFEADAYSHLSGYKASFREKGKKRTYYVFTDEAGEYIYMAQTTKEDETELLDFIAEIGKGNGLDEYDEYYNTFYTIPDNPIDEDTFLGYYVDRLTWSYARSKGYANWAKRMVGHMEVVCYFYNESKGTWYFSLFDLLTDKAERQIYDNLYRKNLESNARRTIYGEQGAAIYTLDWWSGYRKLVEVNLGFDRYVAAISGTTSFSERDLISRLESLQFTQGGYQHPNDSTAPN